MYVPSTLKLSQYVPELGRLSLNQALPHEIE